MEAKAHKGLPKAAHSWLMMDGRFFNLTGHV